MYEANQQNISPFLGHASASIRRSFTKRIHSRSAHIHLTILKSIKNILLCLYSCIMILDFSIQHLICYAGITDDRVQKLIDRAMEAGYLPQRNVVGVITGLMGSGKTTLLCHLFGMAPPDLYTSLVLLRSHFEACFTT